MNGDGRNGVEVAGHRMTGHKRNEDTTGQVGMTDTNITIK